MMRPTAKYWIDRFSMTTHIEGGSFAEVYRSSLLLPQSAIPAFSETRNASTHIYFLLEQGQFSAFHRILSDELWHFYEGDPLIIYEIDLSGKMITHQLGRGESYSPFTMIRAGSWFASVPAQNSEYSLVGCTVAPGFDFRDFELAKIDELLQRFPEFEDIINRLTK